MGKKTTYLIAGNVVALLASLMFAGAYCVFTTFAWFAANETANATGMNVKAHFTDVKVEFCEGHVEREYGKYTYTFDDTFTEMSTDEIDFDDGITRPGSFSIFKLKLTNITETTYTISSVGFLKPSQSEESPVIITPDVGDEEKYYLGTQLYASCVAVDDTDYAGTESVMLTVVDDEFTSGDVYFYSEDIELEPEESVVLTVKVLFKDSGENQDVYKNFGSGEDEVCKRRLIIRFDS